LRISTGEGRLLMEESAASGATFDGLPAPRRGFEWRPQAWGASLECRPLAALACHGWTTRQLRIEGPDAVCGPQWTQVAGACGAALPALARLTQVHGADIHRMAGPDPTARPRADGVMTANADLVLAVRVADCVPLLLADARTGAVAAVHAGWRGTAAGIAARAVESMEEAFDTRPRDLVAAIGPSIGPCCYTVGAELLDTFRRSGWLPDDIDHWFLRGETLRLDLWRATVDQLVGAGLPRSAVSVAELCTACHAAAFYSYRRDGAAAGRLVGFIRQGMRSAN
jgi:YfiH family protein